jgi:hypothetical protein
MSRLLILYMIGSYLSLFNVGCSILHPESLKKKNDYYINHLQSCGPKAAQAAVMDLRKVGVWNKRYITLLEVGKNIQDGGGNSCRLLLSLFHYEAVQITFPYEIKRYFEKQGLTVTEINSLEGLDPKVDTAIVLVRDGAITNQWHWLCFPKDFDIEYHFGKNTRIHLIFLIKKY